MKLFVYLPVALHRNPQKALLISFGVGSTAKALTDTDELKHIDIVDISENVLNLSYEMFVPKKKHPLEDKRVNVFIEDGRFFLKTTDQRYDLITSEPPPPKMAGVVNLYSEEYFRLTYDRLADGGFITYWLPVFQLYEQEAKAIIKSFCSVYEDCSLWDGGGLNWMLVGTRNAAGPVSDERFDRQWRNPETMQELKTLGFETPEQLGALFIADSDFLKRLVHDSQPVVDNFPLRIFPRQVRRWRSKFYKKMTDVHHTSARFQKSRFIKRLWPSNWIEKSLAFFPYQEIINHTLNKGFRGGHYNIFRDLQFVLSESSLRTLPIWLLGKTPEEIEIANNQYKAGNRSPKIQYYRALQALSKRDYPSAIELFDICLNESAIQKPKFFYGRYIFSLCMEKKYTKAEQYVKKWKIPVDQKADLCF